MVKAAPQASAAASRPVRRRLWPKLVLLAFTLLLCFLVGEIAVRLTWQGQWQVPAAALTDPGAFHLRLKPNHHFRISLADLGSFEVATNARGFRGPTVADLARHKARVVAIGDSFTLPWGISVEEQAVFQACQLANAAQPDRDMACALVAQPNWDPQDYYFAYLTEVRPHPVDLVVVGLFPGNDLIAPGTPRYEKPEDVPPRVWQPGNDRPPFWRCYLADWAWNRVTGSAWATQWAIRTGNYPATFQRFVPNDAEQATAWETTLHYLDRLRAATQADGTTLMVVVYPSIVQVNHRDEILAAGLDPDLPEKQVRAWCERQKVPCVTFLEPLCAVNQARDLYFPRDRHLNAKGHRVAAEALMPDLAGLLDRVARNRSAPTPAHPANASGKPDG
jgi:hypothetical protein